MTIHLVRITVALILISLCMFLPYLPGEYDNLAPTLSFIAQFLCFAGLILVPIGIVWLIYETITHRKTRTEPLTAPYYFGVVTSIALSVIVLLVSMTLFVSNNRSLGVFIIILFIYLFRKFIGRVKKLKTVSRKNINPVPFYLICIPLLGLLVRFTLIPKAVEYSREWVIQKSEQLIKDIEIYYQNNGHYPPSMLSVGKDYKTSLMGVKQYHYEPNGKAYNLYFEHVSANLATKEIVMYNKLGEHQMTSHDQDLLLLSENQLNQQRGYFAIHSLSNFHWKYFWFD